MEELNTKYYGVDELNYEDMQKIEGGSIIGIIYEIGKTLVNSTVWIANLFKVMLHF